MYFPACGFTPVAYKVFVQPVDGGKFFMSSLLDDLPLIDNKYLIRLMATTLIINQKHKITMINALIVFIMMYAGMLLLPKWRLYFAIGGAAAMILLSILTPLSAIKAINLNVLMMIVGTMGIVTLFINKELLRLKSAPYPCTWKFLQYTAALSR